MATMLSMVLAVTGTVVSVMRLPLATSWRSATIRS
jgi:hypothetical protein